ncbi:MAG TPA: Gmad2 immunoglobulin-like domain-containing protein, partial [Streptomyces sp.]
AHGRATAIPSGTRLRSVVVRSGVATVDLSGRYDDGASGASAKARLAQVVFTVTRFTGISTVRIALDGKPVTVFGSARVALAHPVGRADFEAQSPSVLVESPLLGDTVSVRTPVRVRGTANTFEAVFQLRLTDHAGRVIADVRAKATSGTGTRGTFDVTVPLNDSAATGTGTLTAYVTSADDGRQVTVETVPVTWGR